MVRPAAVVVAAALATIVAVPARAEVPVRTTLDRGAEVAADRLRPIEDESKLEEQGGALVVGAVAAGGMWEALGLRAGDVILTVDGEAVATELDLRMAGGRLALRDVAYVEVLRKKKPLLLRRVVIRPDAAAPPPAADDREVHVKHLGGTRWEVDADALFADPMLHARGARVVPSIKDGKPNGMKLYAIRTGSVYARLGLKNGDTVSTINGMPLSSADQALEVYTKVRDAKEVTVGIIRRGAPITHTYVRR